MKKRLSLLCVWLSCSVLNVAAAHSGETIHRWQTSQGVPVYFVARPEIPMLDVAMVFSAGSARDGAAWGTAVCVGGLLEEGTTQRNAAQIAAALDDVGAIFDSNVDRDMAVVHLRTLTQAPYAARALALYSELLAGASLPSDAIERVRAQMLDAIHQQQQDPEQVAQEAFYAKVYANQPYGHPTFGTPSTVAALTRDDLLTFYHRYYVAENAKLVMVGALTLAQAKQVAELLARALPHGTAAPALAPSTPATASALFVPMSVAQSAIIMGEQAITRNDPDYLNLVVANYVLGGGSMNSLLFDIVRNQQGLAYSVASAFLTLAANGPFVISLQTRAPAVRAALNTVQQTLGNYLQQGPSAAALELAKRDLINSFPLKVASNDGVLAHAIVIAFYHLPEDYLLTYPQRVAAVTTRTATQAFQRHVHPHAFTTVVVGSRPAASSPQSGDTHAANSIQAKP